MKTNPWKTLSSKIVYRTAWLRLRQDDIIRPDGQPGTYTYVETDGSVYIVAVTPHKEIYLIRQFRYTTAKESLELPAGAIDPGEQPLAAAQRELLEETGLTAKQWQPLGTLDSFNGLSSEVMHVFLASELHQTNRHQQTDEGITELLKLPYREVLGLISEGVFQDSQSLAVLNMAAIKFPDLFLSTN